MSKQTTKDILESKLSLFAPGVDVAILERTMPGVLTAIYAAMHQYVSPSPGWIKASERPHLKDFLPTLDDVQQAYEKSPALYKYAQAVDKFIDSLCAESPAKPEGELQWIKASDLKEKDPNREYIGKWRRGHVNNGRFSADGSSFFFDKYGQVDYMYYDHLFILVTEAAAHSPAGEGPYFTMMNMIGFSEFANGWGWYSRGDQCWWSSHKKDGKREERSTLEMLNEYIKSLKTLTP